MPNVIDIGVKNVVTPSLGIFSLPNIKSTGAAVSPGGGVMNMIKGNNVIVAGYSKGLFGSTDTETPTPPIPPAAATVIVQGLTQLIGSLDWNIVMPDTTAVPGSGPAQNVFTSVTFASSLGSATFFSAAATYTNNPLGFTAQWSWVGGVDIWFGVADGQPITATFA